MSTNSEALTPRFDRLSRQALLTAAVGAVLSLIAAVVTTTTFFQAYLMAYLYWLGMSLGCLGFLMLHHLVGGAWSLTIRRSLEAGAQTLPLMALLFVPLLFGLRTLYPWAHPESVAGDPLIMHKIAYLNVNAFLFRALGYFAIWIVLALVLVRWSLAQDRTGDGPLMDRMRALSGPGMVLHILAGTFAAIDWMMSLEPHWYSTIYSAIVIVANGLASLALVILVTAWLADTEPLSELATPRVFQDLGNLLLAFVMLWTYMSFSQFLIIWSGNLAEEVPWYLKRNAGGWQAISVLLIVLLFAVPFLALLMRRVKRDPRVLARLALAIVVLRFVELYWQVAPAFPERASLRLHWQDVAALAGVGGVWVAAFLGLLRSRPLVPINDPRLERARERAQEGH